MNCSLGSTVRQFTSAMVLLAAFSLTSLSAQQPREAADRKLPKPEQQSLTTKDQVVLHCVYFPGTEGQQTVPVILLHGWEGLHGPGSARDFDGLAALLQRAGHAVIVPDLRGHGRSTARRFAGTARAQFDRDRLQLNDFQDMIRYDLEAVKKFLLTKHNDGELNIELLCVVGADMGAVVGANWVAQDWSWPILPAIKQGQDVKAYVLISPPQTFKGLPIQAALRFPHVRALSAMIIYGKKDSDAAQDGNRIYSTLKRFHPDEPETPEEVARRQKLFLVELNTSLQGTKLLHGSLDTAKRIEQFIELRLVNFRDRYPWQPRQTSP